MFGGRIYNGSYFVQDGIWYIDMNPQNPTTTDPATTKLPTTELPPDTTTLFPDTFCVNRTNGE